jgi:hypothetical protein
MRTVSTIIPTDPDERAVWFAAAITATHWAIPHEEPITEVSLAENFGYWHHGGPERIRYVASSDRWIVDVRDVELNTQGWRFDNSRIVYWLAGRFLTLVARNLNNPATARRICTTKMRTAIVDLARDASCLIPEAKELAEALARQSQTAAAE